MRRKYNCLSFVFAVVTVAALAVFVYALRFDGRASRAFNVRPEPFRIGSAPTLGAATSRLALVVFSDFQCAYCRTLARATLPDIVARYVRPGSVELVFKHLPLPELHPFALPAARLAECARAVSDDLFWRTHDELFSALTLNDEFMYDLAASLGLERAVLDKCRVAPETAMRILEATADARDLGVTSTPTILLGVKGSDGDVKPVTGYVGAVDTSVLASEIDRLLAVR